MIVFFSIIIVKLKAVVFRKMMGLFVFYCFLFFFFFSDEKENLTSNDL